MTRAVATSRPAPRVCESIEKGIIAPGYLLAGRETYWRDRIWSGLRTALHIESPEFGVVEYDLKHTPLDPVLAAAREQSLWTPRQLLLIRNAQALSATKGLSELGGYFEKPSASSVCVFEMTEIDPESGDWREREKAKGLLDAWGGICDIALLLRPDMAECLELIRRESAARGRSISLEAAQWLAAVADRSMGRIAIELEKICLANPEQSEIAMDEVRRATEGLTARCTQSLTEAVASGDSRKALEALAESVRGGVYWPLVLAELARHLRQLLLLREGSPRDPWQAGKILSAAKLFAPQSAMLELLRQARIFSAEHLAHCLLLAYQADLALRSSPSDDRLVVERLVLQVMRPVRAAATLPHRETRQLPAR